MRVRRTKRKSKEGYRMERKKIKTKLEGFKEQRKKERKKERKKVRKSKGEN